MGEVMEAAERSASLPGHGTRGLPLQTLLTATPLKFQLVNCAEVTCLRLPPAVGAYARAWTIPAREVRRSSPGVLFRRTRAWVP